MQTPARRDSHLIGECSLDVVRYGSGAPVVVLHGEYGSLFLASFLQRLGESYDVFVPHHPGWGQSSRPVYVKTIRDVALVQQEFLEGFDHPVSLIGLSLGGWIAAEIAATCPSLVESLILVSPTGIKAGGREDRDFADIYVTDTLERHGLFYNHWLATW